MQRLHPLKLSKELRSDDLRQRDGPVFLPLAVVDGQHASIRSARQMTPDRRLPKPETGYRKPLRAAETEVSPAPLQMELILPALRPAPLWMVVSDRDTLIRHEPLV